jgi:hypothetical protein
MARNDNDRRSPPTRPMGECMAVSGSDKVTVVVARMQG